MATETLPGRRLDALVFDHYQSLDLLQAVCDANPGVAGQLFLGDHEAAALVWPARANPVADVAALYNGWGDGLEAAE